MKKIFSDIVLISDMDDTLLTEDKKITKENLDAIERFRELGGTFTIATGRGAPSFEQYKPLVNVTSPVILNNGAVIYDANEDKVLWDVKLPFSAKRIVEITREKFPDVGCEVYVDNQIYIIYANHRVTAHLDHEKLKSIHCTLDDVNGAWYKVLYALDEEEMPEFNAFLETLEADGFYYVNSSKWYCEMLPKNCSKGVALDEMRTFKEFENKTFCAVGDFYNDIEMIKTADIGFAVGNAPDDVKQYADVVVSTNEEHAIADVLEYLIKKFG